MLRVTPSATQGIPQQLWGDGDHVFLLLTHPLKILLGASNLQPDLPALMKQIVLDPVSPNQTSNSSEFDGVEGHTSKVPAMLSSVRSTSALWNTWFLSGQRQSSASDWWTERTLPGLFLHFKNLFSPKPKSQTTESKC